jgi:hypothetical protein
LCSCTCFWSCRKQQQDLQREVAALHKVLAAKQARMEEVIKNSAAMPVMKQHYDKMLLDLQADRDKLQKERMALHQVGRGQGRASVLPGPAGACSPVEQLCMWSHHAVHASPGTLCLDLCTAGPAGQARLIVQVGSS